MRVFTTRPDTLFGATYMVLAPEHELVDTLVAGRLAGRHAGTPGPAGTPAPGEAVAAYRKAAAAKTDVERQADAKEKTGVFIGAYATNPVTGGADPGLHRRLRAGRLRHRRDHGGARRRTSGTGSSPRSSTCRSSVPCSRRRASTARRTPGDGPAINSAAPERGLDLNGLGVAEAKAAIIAWLEANGHGDGAVTYRLRDWLFSRQRYWGEPFPIVYDETGLPIALPESMLPVELPEVDDFSPKTFDADDADSNPETPLSRRARLGRGRAGPGRRAEALHPRDQRDAAVGRLLLVRAALPGPDQQRAVRRPGERAVLDGPARRR